ncbi:PREDICTED: TMV resistance protein N-like [Tarenaya hassleriana]|uniref:TMV resistance protein N-like n=1 Tax=Tarenaya hassleriana TaxID=28532 RepID=UPI00053C38F2|nr:PREDICTED: TMV resistance protein N-like [Tarenaya hassleriana]
MQKLSKSDSFEFFSRYAIKKYRKGMTSLIPGLVNYASGVPLVLIALGSSLKKHQIHEKGLLQILRRHPPTEVQDAFRRSFDGLDDNEKNIFLDLACFLRGENKDYVVQMLDGCGFFTDLGICGLIDESLISLVDNRIEMANVFQDMGRFVVHEENEEPGKRSRLWDAKDIADVLTNNKGTAAIEGIFLDASDLMCELSPSALQNVYRLRLLKFYCSTTENQCKLHLPQGLNSLPDELRLLHWENYPLKSLPRDFNPKNLVELNMPYSNMEKLWKGTKNLEKLKKIRLSHSRQLAKIPRLSKALNLEHIDLEGCTNLVKVSSSIHHLGKLVLLNLKDCTRLRSLPGIVHLKSLEVLNMSGCSDLENIQDFSPNLKELYLARTAIREVPSSIENLTELTILDLEHCKMLRHLTMGMSNLKSLGTLKLSGCSSLESLPYLDPLYLRGSRHLDLKKKTVEKSAPFVSYVPAIRGSRLDGSENLLSSPTSLPRSETPETCLTYSSAEEAYKFSSIQGSSNLSLYSLGKLPSSILYSLASRLYAVVSLSLYNACLQDIPSEIFCMPSLKALDLSGNGFTKLPESVKMLSKLLSIRLHRCKNLASLPELPRSLELLDMHGCTSLESIKWCFEQIPRLCIFSNCFDLSQEVVRELVAKALKSVVDMAGEHHQALIDSPAFSICVPTSVRGIPKTSTWTSSPIITQLTSRRMTLLGFVLSVSVSLSDAYSAATGFGIRCVCRWRTKNGISHRLERIFRFWEPRETAQKLQRDHTFAFYDVTLHPGDDIMDDRIEFELCPVDGQNTSLHDSCKVTQCGVYNVTALTGDTSPSKKRAASSMDPGELCDGEEVISRYKRVRLRRVIETIILEIRKRKRRQVSSFQNIEKDLSH